MENKNVDYLVVDTTAFIQNAPLQVNKRNFVYYLFLVQNAKFSLAYLECYFLKI